MTFTFRNAWNPAGHVCAKFLISQIEFRESVHVCDSISRAPPRFAAVHSACRADGRAPRQIGKTVDVVGRFFLACPDCRFRVHPESAELRSSLRKSKNGESAEGRSRFR